MCEVVGNQTYNNNYSALDLNNPLCTYRKAQKSSTHIDKDDAIRGRHVCSIPIDRVGTNTAVTESSSSTTYDATK